MSLIANVGMGAISALSYFNSLPPPVQALALGTVQTAGTYAVTKAGIATVSGAYNLTKSAGLAGYKFTRRTAHKALVGAHYALSIKDSEITNSNPPTMDYRAARNALKTSLSKKRRTGSSRRPGTSRSFIIDTPKQIARASLSKNGGMPQTLKINLYAAETQTLGTTTATYAKQSYPCNDLYNPFGTSHQPHYFDQWALFYKHYRVIASKIKITPYGDVDKNVFLALFIDDDDTIDSNGAGDISERSGVKWFIRNFSVDSSGKPTLSMTYDAEKYWGPTGNNDKQVADVGSSPTERTFFTFHGRDLEAGSSFRQSYFVEIWWTIEFSNLREVAGS